MARNTLFHARSAQIVEQLSPLDLFLSAIRLALFIIFTPLATLVFYFSIIRTNNFHIKREKNNTRANGLLQIFYYANFKIEEQKDKKSSKR
jgi:hypothetical protein